MMTNSSRGWTWSTLGEVAEWGSGGTPSRSVADYYGGDIPWIKTGELGPRVVSKTEEFISKLGLNNSSAKVFPKGSVAVAMYGATIGKTSILGVDAATNQACAVGKPRSDLITKEYLYHFLCSQREKFVEAGKGGAQPNISQSVIKAWKIPLPSLSDQKRITDKLDTLLARVDATRERLDRIPALLKRFRQSVLAVATTGELTTDWREGRSADWDMVRIKDVGYARLGKMLDKSKNTGVETPYLRNVNVRWFGFDLADIQDIRVSEQERVELSLRKGDVLVCEGGEPGRCAIWDRDDSRFVYQKALHRVRLGERCLPQWFCYLLKDAADSGTLNRLFTGTTIKHLTGSSLSVWQFPLPSLNEQIEIVRRVETLFAMAGQVEYRHKVAVNGANGITPALFGNSFAGRLFSMK